MLNKNSLFSTVQICLLLSTLFIVTSLNAHAALKNQLKDHPSPYLAMHGDDPVAWQVWGKDVLAQAKKENKLLFVSVGYFSCHWCHVMQRESYADNTVAKKLNSNFIPVKVDRELFPALDAYLIDFVQQTRGHAGWPLNVFVTPDGYPVVGIVYSPKAQFLQLLDQLTDMWTKNDRYMTLMAQQAAAQHEDKPLKTQTSLKKAMAKKAMSSFAQQTMLHADDMMGGFGEQTKFPMTAQMQTLILAYEKNGYKPIKQFVELTLEQMATQGLRDHVGGGFFRYTVDPSWQTPHFEKMLYDNANLASLYFRAAKVFKRNDFAMIARETLDFMIRELTTKEGAMISSLSAVDDAGIEGGYYLWQKEQIKNITTAKEFEVLNLLWDMDTPHILEAGYLPRQAQSPDDVAKALGEKTSSIMGIIASAYGKLHDVRKKRTVPRDTKQLAAWNGLALSALVAGAKLENGQKYRQAAKTIRQYILDNLSKGNILWRAKSGVGAIGQAGLEDYAYVAQGLIDWATLTNNEEDFKRATVLVKTAWKKFYTATGWQLSDESLLPHSIGVPIVIDNPMPSPSAMLIRGSVSMGKRYSDQKLLQHSELSLTVGEKLLQTQPFSYATQIEAMSEFF